MADKEVIEEIREEAEGKKKGSNKLLLAAFLVIGLGFGGGGAYFFLNGDAVETDGTTEGIEDAEDEEDVEELELRNVLFEGMAVPVYNTRGKYIGNYKITVKVITENDNDNVRVKNAKFELRHAFISRIAEGGLLQENSAKLDYDKTANILKDIAKRVVGERIIYGVTIEDVVRVNN